MWLPLQLLCILGLASSIMVEEELWMGKEAIPNLGPQDQSTKYQLFKSFALFERNSLFFLQDG